MDLLKTLFIGLLTGLCLNSSAQSLAFPGAEGYGKYTEGGRGGRVIIVSNLNDKGEGSFRDAVNAAGRRIVMFAVSGTIHLESPLFIKGDVTIAGQSAPGDGICLADFPVSLGGDNIIVRYMRFRMGDKNQRGGMVNGNGGDDAFGGQRRKNIIIDHCSMSWSTDEVFSVYAGDSTTVQWNIISEPLNYSYHFETGDKDYEHHGFGGIMGGRHFTAHHNLWAHCTNRTPRFDGIRNSPTENVDMRNNVIYNWGGNNVYAGEGGNYNVADNYYRPGPSTAKNALTKVVNPYKTARIPFGKFYIAGNLIEGSTEVSKDNWLGVDMQNGTDQDKEKAKMTVPFPSVQIPAQSATDAYKAVLESAGASFRRDTLDQRIIKDVKERRGDFVDVQGGYAHGTAYESTVNAWPALKSGKAPADTDKDGMPDAWEKSQRLNAAVNDAAAFTIDERYSNIEMYLNSVLK